jgi:two-component sensor histidine kinase
MKQKFNLPFLFILLTLLSAHTYANPSNDQLSDSAYKKAKSTVDSCNFYFDKNEEKYQSFAKQFDAIDFSQLIDSNFREVIYERTDFLRRKFKYKEAITILSEALSIAKSKKDTLSKAFFHKRMSTHYYRLGHLDSTTVQLEKAYSLYDYLNNETEMGIMAIRKSRVAYDQGNYENAIKYSFKAIELHKASANKAKMAISYLQLGNTYLYLSNHIVAKKYFEVASILFKKTGNEFGYAEAISNFGLVEIKTEHYQKGINKQFASLKYFINEGHAIEAGVIYHFLVEAYLGLQQYDSSIYYNELAKKEFEKSNFQKGFCQSYLNEATVFFVKKEYDKALESALKCYEIAVDNSYNKLLEESNYELYRIYKKLNEPTKSFQHLEQYVNIKDSLNFNPYVLQSEAMKYQLAAEEAQLYREIAEERAKLEHQRGEKTEQQLINTIVIAILISISLLVAIYYLLKNRKLNKNLNLQSELLSEDLKVKESLLSEVHHRVKNNLQVINSMLSLQNQYVSDESLNKIIDDCKGRIISMSLIHESLYRKQDFKEALFSNYIQELLPRLISTYGADPGKIHLSMDIEPIKLSLDDSVPCGLLLNEIVSNSLKHAFPQEQEGNIRIELKQIENEVHLTVADDGVGLKKGKLFRTEDSFGFLLIETLANQLGADLTINTLNGFTYHIKWKH